MANRYWFAPKQYGIGYSPASWEGWLVTALFVGLLVGSIHLLRMLMAGHPTGQIQMLTTLTALVETALFLLLVAMRTEGSLHWRWGGRKLH
jgi:hypothetical protein